MSSMTHLHSITTAEAHDITDFSDPFGIVEVADGKGSAVKLFFPVGVSEAVAAAIRAAIANNDMLLWNIAAKLCGDNAERIAHDEITTDFAEDSAVDCADDENPAA